MVVKSLSLKFQMAWIKDETQSLLPSLLTHDHRVITNNSRISVVEREGDWLQLKIKDLTPSDQGWYMCQINTDPIVSDRAFLEVKGLLKKNQS